MTLETYLKNFKNYKPLTCEEEVELFKKAKKGDRQAYEKIILSNIKFVISVAKKYIGLGASLEDLISEGVLGLLRAYEKFEVDKGFKFITYAVWWIRQSIIEFLNTESKLIRLPLNRTNSISKILKIKKKLEYLKGEEVSVDELQHYIENPETIEDLKYINQILNLDEPLTDDDNDLKDIIPDENSLKEIEEKFLKEEIQYILEDFPDREKEIICLYFGIENPRAYTLDEISVSIGLTKERVRQIKEKTIDKLKNNKNIQNLI